MHGTTLSLGFTHVWIDNTGQQQGERSLDAVQRTEHMAPDEAAQSQVLVVWCFWFTPHKQTWSSDGTMSVSNSFFTASVLLNPCSIWMQHVKCAVRELSPMFTFIKSHAATEEPQTPPHMSDWSVPSLNVGDYSSHRQTWGVFISNKNLM